MKKILYRWENQREDRKKIKSLKIVLGKKSRSNVVETYGDPAQEFGFYFKFNRKSLKGVKEEGWGVTQSDLHFQKLPLVKDWRMDSRIQEKKQQGHGHSPWVTWMRDLTLAMRDQQESPGLDSVLLRMPPWCLIEQLGKSGEEQF